MDPLGSSLDPIQGSLVLVPLDPLGSDVTTSGSALSPGLELRGVSPILWLLVLVPSDPLGVSPMLELQVLVQLDPLVLLEPLGSSLVLLDPFGTSFCTLGRWLLGEGEL